MIIGIGNCLIRTISLVPMWQVGWPTSRAHLIEKHQGLVRKDVVEVAQELQQSSSP